MKVFYPHVFTFCRPNSISSGKFTHVNADGNSKEAGIVRVHDGQNTDSSDAGFRDESERMSLNKVSSTTAMAWHILPSVVTWRIPDIEMVVLLEIEPGKLLVQCRGVHEWSFPSVRMPHGRAEKCAEVARAIQNGLGLAVELVSEIDVELLHTESPQGFGAEDYGPCRLYRARIEAQRGLESNSETLMTRGDTSASLEDAGMAAAEVLASYMGCNQEVTEVAAVNVGEMYRLTMCVRHRSCRLACWRSLLHDIDDGGGGGGAPHLSPAFKWEESGGTPSELSPEAVRSRSPDIKKREHEGVNKAGRRKGLLNSSGDGSGGHAGQVAWGSNATIGTPAVRWSVSSPVGRVPLAKVSTGTPFLTWVASALVKNLERERLRGQAQETESHPGNAAIYQNWTVDKSARLAAARFVESQVDPSEGWQGRGSFERCLARILASCTDCADADGLSGKPCTEVEEAAVPWQACGKLREGAAGLVKSVVVSIVRDALEAGDVVFTVAHLKHKPNIEVAKESCILTALSAKRQLFLRQTREGFSRAVTVASHFAEAYDALLLPG